MNLNESIKQAIDSKNLQKVNFDLNTGIAETYFRSNPSSVHYDKLTFGFNKSEISNLDKFLLKDSMKGARVGAVAGGSIIGGIIGNAIADDDNKGVGTVIGATVGGIGTGTAIHAMKNTRISNIAEHICKGARHLL
jgi:hypothetical protein